MAGKRLKLDDIKRTNHELSPDQLNELKGGYKYVPSGSGSVGLINWDGVDIRDENIGDEELPGSRRLTHYRHFTIRRK